MNPDSFWSMFDRSDPAGCWNWPRRKTVDGYGKFKANGKNIRAHRYAYEQSNGKIPDGMFVCHSCDNPACCNPNHLWIGSLQDNHADMMKKGRWHSMSGVFLRGEKHPLAKLSNHQREVIKVRAKSGDGYRSLARAYNVTDTTIREVCLGKSYAYRKRKPAPSPTAILIADAPKEQRSPTS